MGKRIVFFAAVAAGLGAAALVPLQVLFLSADDRVVFSRIVKPGDTFRLGYLHSVARSDVWDLFTVDGDYRIVLTETRFRGQGAGLPSLPSPGESWHREEQGFRISGMRRTVPFISWRVQKKWNSRFQFKNEPETDLSGRLDDGLVRIEVQRIRGWEWVLLALRARGT